MANNNKIASELLDLKKRIDAAKSMRDKLSGELQAHYKALEAHGCKTVEEAEAKMADLDKQAEALEEKYNALYEEVSSALA